MIVQDAFARTGFKAGDTVGFAVAKCGTSGGEHLTFILFDFSGLMKMPERAALGCVARATRPSGGCVETAGRPVPLSSPAERASGAGGEDTGAPQLSEVQPVLPHGRRRPGP